MKLQYRAAPTTSCLPWLTGTDIAQIHSLKSQSLHNPTAHNAMLRPKPLKSQLHCHACLCSSRAAFLRAHTRAYTHNPEALRLAAYAQQKREPWHRDGDVPPEHFGGWLLAGRLGRLPVLNRAAMASLLHSSKPSCCRPAATNLQAGGHTCACRLAHLCKRPTSVPCCGNSVCLARRA